MDAIVYNLETQAHVEGQPIDEEAAEAAPALEHELQAA